MRSKLISALTVIGAVTVLVLAANTVALATTGKAILAGKINTSGKITSLVRTTPGTALQVKTKSTANAPFAVNGTGKVANLNADKVDGIDSAALKTTATGYTLNINPGTDSLGINLPLPTGHYILSYSAYLLGADDAAGYATCYFFRNQPSTPTAYIAEDKDATAASVTPGLSGTGFVSKTANTTVGFHCDASSAFTTSAAEPIQITAIKVDTLNKGTLALAKQTAKGAK